MEKVKTVEEYEKHLLDKKDSKREPRTETGLILVDIRPPWADNAHLWGRERRYNRKIEGWEKLCIEAYFSGWLDYHYTNVQKVDQIIYFQWEDIHEKQDKYILLRIYLNPGTTQGVVPPFPVLVDKPPLPPMS